MVDSCNIPLLLAPTNLSLYFAFYMYETNLALKIAAYWPHCHRMMENTLPKPNWDCTSGGSLRLCHQLELRLGPGPSQGSGEIVKGRQTLMPRGKRRQRHTISEQWFKQCGHPVRNDYQWGRAADLRDQVWPKLLNVNTKKPLPVS